MPGKKNGLKIPMGSYHETLRKISVQFMTRRTVSQEQESRRKQASWKLTNNCRAAAGQASTAWLRAICRSLLSFAFDRYQKLTLKCVVVEVSTDKCM